MCVCVCVCVLCEGTVWVGMGVKYVWFEAWVEVLFQMGLGEVWWQ